MVASRVNHVIRGLKLSVPPSTLQGGRVSYWLKMPFIISKAILLVMNIFVFCCVLFFFFYLGKCLFFLKDNFAGIVFLVGTFLSSFITLNICSHSLLACRISTEKTSETYGSPMYITKHFLLPTWKFSLSLSTIWLEFALFYILEV